MDLHRFNRVSEYEWRIEPQGRMRVPGILYATEALMLEMDDKVFEQLSNVAMLPGIVKAAYAMPDAHWGYGFPIGGVAAFDPDEGGIVSAGGVGFDISCGVRTLHTGLRRQDIEPVKEQLAEHLFHRIPAGVGSTGNLELDAGEMEAMLAGGAQWAVSRGYGVPEDLERIEERGCMRGALPEKVSIQAKRRMREEVGTLGSGNHYLEMQEVVQVFDRAAADAFEVAEGDILVSIHCGSRGLGHQIGTEALKGMVMEASRLGLTLPDRELACAPIGSAIGRSYLGAMRAAINCALANRQVLTHLAREVFTHVLRRGPRLSLIYDVSHNTCKEEEHEVDGRSRRLFVHRKGATRAFGPDHPDLPAAFRKVGQPVLIGGSMGTASYILAGVREGESRAFSSSCHGAGRAMSRHQASRNWSGKAVVAQLAEQGIRVCCRSWRGVAEEAPGAYKDVSEVVDAADLAGLSRKVAKLAPILCIKG